MPGLVLRRPAGVFDPRRRYGLDYSNPITRKLKHAWGPRSALHWVDHADPRTLAGTTFLNSEWSADREGDFIYRSSWYGGAGPPPLGDSSGSGGPTGSAFSIQTKVLFGSYYNNGSTLAYTFIGSFGGVQFRREGDFGAGGDALVLNKGNVAFLGSANLPASILTDFTNPHDFGMSYDGSVAEFYLDGVQLTPYYPGAGPTSFDPVQYHLGGRSAADSETMVSYGRFYYMRLWDRVLSPAEFRSLHRRPNQIYAKRNLSLSLSASVSVQTIYPSITTGSGNWVPSTGSDLWAVIDEPGVPDDADYASTPNASSMTVQLQSSGTPPNVTTGHIVHYRCKGAGTLLVELVQGGTTIASWTHNPAPVNYTTFDQTLTGLEAAAISNYANLKLRFTAS